MVTTIRKYTGGVHPFLEFACLSTDTKPVDLVPDNSICHEIDTGKKYYIAGGVWHEAPSRGGSGGGLPADFPAEGSANANKFLGFDSSGDYAALNAPSGGGDEKFVVTLTHDEQKDLWTAADGVTVAQIYAAHQAGEECVAQLTYQVDGMDVPVEAPLSFSIEFEDDGETTYVCMFSTPFAFETDTIAMLNIAGYGWNTEEWGVELATVANPVPSYGSYENGKVLGVSSGDLAWVDNYAPLIVTMAEDKNNPGTYVGDKTFSEIKTAFEAGRNVVGNIPVLDASVSVIQVAVDNSNIAISTGNKDIAFIGAANEYPSITP